VLLLEQFPFVDASPSSSLLDELPAHERLQYITESIRKVDNIKDKIEWYKSMEDVLEHNYDTLINKLYKIPKEFNDIKKYCQTIYKKLL
jgi:predicted patatin/cPLA2 family phospholipase